MGVVKRQSIKFTIVSLIGTFIGAFSVLFIYPLNDDLYGYAAWLFSTAAILVPIGSLGIPSMIVKFFTNYEGRDKGDFFSLVIGLYLLSFSVFVGAYLLVRPLLFRFFYRVEFDVIKLSENDFWLLVISFLFGLVRILFNFSAVKKRIAIPQLLENVGYKIYLPIIFLLVVWNHLSAQFIIYGIVIFFVILIIVLIIYDISIGSFKLKFPRVFRSNEPKKSMLEFSLFGSLNGLGNIIAMRLDMVMIPLILTNVDNGIYAKLLVIVNILSLPLQSVLNISNPIVSEHWHNNNKAEINKLYKQSSNNLLFITMLFFLMIYFSMPYLVQISGKPESFTGFALICLLLGIGKLTDAYGSINSSIIIYSKKFRMHLYFILIMAGLNLVLNVTLMKEHGLIGAAIATAISLVIFNIIKSGYIYFRFNLHCFSTSNLKTLLLGCTLFFLLSSINLVINPYLYIVLLGVFLTITFLVAALLFDISEEITETIQNSIQKLKAFI